MILFPQKKLKECTDVLNIVYQKKNLKFKPRLKLKPLKIGYSFYNRFPKFFKEKMFCNVLFYTKRSFLFGTDLYLSPIFFTTKLLLRVSPLVRFRGRMVTGRFHKIPYFLGFNNRDHFHAISWIFFSQFFYKKNLSLDHKIGMELLAIQERKSYSWKQRQIFHSLAANSQPLLKFYQKLFLKNDSFFYSKNY